MKHYLSICLTALTVFCFSQQIKAQITTSEITVEETNDLTTILGSTVIGNTTSDIGDLFTVGGHVNIGGDGDKILKVRHIFGKQTQESGVDNLYLNFGQGKHVYVGHGGQDSDLYVSGNTGIGTTSPNKKLHVVEAGIANPNYLDASVAIFEGGEGKFQIISSDAGSSAAQLLLTSAPTTGSNKHWGIHHSGVSWGDRLDIGYGTSSSSGNFWNLTPKMTILTGGNVGIGTTNPTEKLHVNGKIRATGQVGWADFVFEEDYFLPKLEQVENDIEKIGHLPGIPSAQEVRQNGIDLTEMDSKLLQKIEELTLYLIEQNKKLKDHEDQIAELKRRLESEK